MIWDDHEAAWQRNLTTVTAFHTEHGHLAIPDHQPGGRFLGIQRTRARDNRLDPDRHTQLAALDPDWTLPRGPDWHRKYHLLRRHIEAGNSPAALHRDTVIGEVKVGSWLHRQLSPWDRLAPAQQALLARLQLTPATPLPPSEPAGGEAAPSFLRAERAIPPALRRALEPPGRCTGMDRGRRRTHHDRHVAAQDPY
ncbi:MULTISPECIES: helicase associated domain-containing protein [unclassified Streptomyces]|uniref:helicase associated domain-containing protein n=1 Tax=unclassified Streptomyces TaxID=2593676 RepID=UPI0011AD67BA|nr:helicase associated domain-containing protein [Streptomyces sp. BK340]TVZ94921.1 helicase associated protein [Streptomyces sp. BK340]